MANYQSTHTGQEIDAAVDNATKVVANPTLSGSEAELTSIGVDGTNYKVPSGGGGGGTTVGGGYTLRVIPSGGWGDTYYDFMILGSYNGVYGWYTVHIDANAFSDYLSGTINGVPFQFDVGVELIFNNACLFVNTTAFMHDQDTDIHMRSYDGTVVLNSQTAWNGIINKLCYLTGDCTLSSED